MNHNDHAYPALRSAAPFGATAQSRWLLRGEAMGRLLARAFATMRRTSDAGQGRFGHAPLSRAHTKTRKMP